MKRINLFTLVCLLTALFTLCSVSYAEDHFPDKPIKIIVPYAAGGAADMTTRLAAQVAEKYLGQPIAVENRAGGGGVSGQSTGAKAAADGYTLTEISPSVITNPITKKTDYTADSFIPIVLMVNEAETVATKPGQFKDIESLISFSKENPKKIKVGVSGAMNSDHLAVLLFNKMTDTEWVVVPFNGSAPAMASFLGGHVDVTIVGPSELSEQVRAGEVIYPVTFANKRLSGFSEVPTGKEKGINLVIGPWRGLAAPKGTPEDRVNIIADAFVKAFNDPAFTEAYEKADLPADTWSDRKDFTEIYENQKISLAEVIKSAKSE